MSESSGSAFRVIERFDRLPNDLRMRGNDHLANPFPVIYGEWFGGEVYKDDADFSSVIGIDGSRGI